MRRVLRFANPLYGDYRANPTAENAEDTEEKTEDAEEKRDSRRSGHTADAAAMSWRMLSGGFGRSLAVPCEGRSSRRPRRSSSASSAFTALVPAQAGMMIAQVGYADRFEYTR